MLQGDTEWWNMSEELNENIFIDQPEIYNKKTKEVQPKKSSKKKKTNK